MDHTAMHDPSSVEYFDQRRDERHLVCIVAQLQGDGRPRTAVTWDVNDHGALLLTRSVLRQGDRVRVALHTGSGATPGHIVEGRVVRTERLDARRQGLWTYGVAVEFRRPAYGLASTAKHLAERQADIFGAVE
ncbi:MAG: PilZ domain-containing protein [Deltaproteobacteria bacterium]|nr:PilZ domain-containing protein [Deltaproteobacteria bacterium]